MKRDKEACRCRSITYGMIEDAIRGGARSVEAVEQVTHFGGGCGQCRDFIAHLVRELLEELP